MKIPLIIDTDLGGDIDDALAVSMALHSDILDIRGITTVYRANVWRKGIIQRMLAAYRRPDIPVLMGAEEPLIGTWQQAGTPPPCQPNEAVPFLIEQARACPQLHIAAIGPLTNIALALAAAPDIAPRLRLFVMGGMLTCAHPEWNILCDPEAAAAVLRSGAEITLVGLDVTERCQLDAAQAEALVAGEGEELAFLRGEMARFQQNFSFLPVLHDPLVIASLLWDDLLQYEMKDVVVEMGGQYTRGVTVDQRFGQRRRIRAAVGVKAEEAVRRICARVRHAEQ